MRFLYVEVQQTTQAGQEDVRMRECARQIMQAGASVQAISTMEMDLLHLWELGKFMHETGLASILSAVFRPVTSSRQGGETRGESRCTS